MLGVSPEKTPGAPSALEYAHLEALKFLREASGYENSETLEEHFVRVLTAFGFDRYSCWRWNRMVRAQNPAVLSSKDLAEWDAHWLAQGYQDIDPVGQLAFTGAPSFTWSHARSWARQSQGQTSKLEEKLWGEARENGMGDGMISRAMGPGGHTLMVRMTTPDRFIRPADRPMLDSVAIIFCNLLLRLQEREADRKTDGILTQREEECLRWASRGLVDPEIAEQLGISIKTVAFHMENAKRKLGAKTRLAAYRCAQELGLMT
jgi:LuxR family transcriptional activator of conjugal transfer of Ti plasmids